MAFLAIGKLDFLCLFAIQDEVTGEKSSNLRGNYLRQRRLPKYGMLRNYSKQMMFKAKILARV